MRSRRWQRGEGKAGCIFWALVFGVGGLIAFRMVPLKIADMQLRDHMDELAKLYPRKDGKWFTDSIHKRAKELRLPLKRKDIKVEKTKRRVRMQVKYTVPLDFLVYEKDWEMSHDMERDIFIMGSLPRAPEFDFGPPPSVLPQAPAVLPQAA